MEKEEFIGKAWNNGAHHSSGAGYGIKLSVEDRDRHFEEEWNGVILTLEGVPRSVEVNIKKESFWGTTCRELISKEIGSWLINNEKAPWPKGNPPKIHLTNTKDNEFKAKLL